MFTIHIAGQPSRGFEGTSVSIGRSTRSALVLPSPEVSRNHAVIEERAGRFTLEDLDSSHGTYVDGARIARAEITSASRIRIGPFELTLEPGAGTDATEARLLAAIATERDPASRQVYADWLEQRGEHVKAEFLRLQESLVGISPADLEQASAIERTERLRQLAASIDMGWRYRVARPAVEGCTTRFSFKCPREWAAMDATDRDNVRHCSACNKHVYYAANVAIARLHVEKGDCVVVDIIPKRAPGDLNLPPPPIRMAGAMAQPPPRTGWRISGAGTGPAGDTLFLHYHAQRYAMTSDHIPIGGAGSILPIQLDGHDGAFVAVIRRNGSHYIKDLTGAGIGYRGMVIDNKRIDEGDAFQIGPHELRFTFRG